MLVGFTGLSESGKDTCADMLAETRPSQRGTFAAPLKSALAPLFDFSYTQLYGDHKNVIDERHGITPREAMLWLGDEVRAKFGEDFFVDRMRREIEMTKKESPEVCVVISDVRLDNEAQMIRDMGGVVVKVNRPSVVRKSDHKTEGGISPHLIDHVIENDVSLEELKFKIEELDF